MSDTPPEAPAGSGTKAGWKVEQWAADCGLSRAYTYGLLARGTIESVRIGKHRIITTSPREYLATLKGAAGEAA